MRLNGPPTRTLRPVNPDNARFLRITAAAGTQLAGASSDGTVKQRVVLTPAPSSHLTGVYAPKDFILHVASLHPPFGDCANF